MEVLYRQLRIEDITPEIFLPFNRYQEVEQCWRKVDGKWVLQDIPFIDDWGESEKIFLVKCLQNTIGTGGMVFGAFYDNALVAFASLENDLFGSKNQYLQLSSIHTSHEFRGHGIGKSLFRSMCKRAESAGAKKLYISAHSSKETQAFYRNIGCVEAIEINERLLEKEPFDCQLEYDLRR